MYFHSSFLCFLSFKIRPGGHKGNKPNLIQRRAAESIKSQLHAHKYIHVVCLQEPKHKIEKAAFRRLRNARI